MNIQNIKDLNMAEKLLQSTIEAYPNPLGLVLESINSLEREIQAFKYHQDIKTTCGVCGAHKKRDGNFVVEHNSTEFSEKKQFARICKYAKEGCINSCSSVTKKEQYSLGYMSLENLNTLYSFQVSMNKPDA